jgi:hypothetical protein
MTSAELRTELDRRGLTTQMKAAAALCVDQKTVSRWLRGECSIPRHLPLTLSAIPAVKARRKAA